MMKKQLFQIASISTMVAGASSIALDMVLDFDGMMAIPGVVLIVLGIILFVTGQMYSSVTEAKEVQLMSYIIMLGSLVVVLGVVIGFIIEDGPSLISLGGAGLIFLGFLLWPCICCQGETKNKSKIIGIARSHESITITEISQITRLASDTVRALLYDAIGNGELYGKMEGETFMRSAPAARGVAPSSTTTHRETVKVLVICPYCGAKTEQGLTKCQNCQADL
ncbi:MAG: hypothetical protein ACTSV2_18730 [Candidatus Thorarchaeota archaeon]